MVRGNDSHNHACPQPVGGGIVYIKYCVCKIRHLVLCTTTTTDGRQYLLNIFCMSTETDRLSTGMVDLILCMISLYYHLKYLSESGIHSDMIWRKSDFWKIWHLQCGDSANLCRVDFDYGVTLADGLLLHQQDGGTSQNQLAKPGFMSGIATL